MERLETAMLRLMLALAAVLIVAASLASRLSEVHAAGKKTGASTGWDLRQNSKTSRTTASGKHIPKGQLNVR